MTTIAASACEIARHGVTVVLTLETPGEDERDVAAVMSPREARRLMSRLGKAANDAASAHARALAAGRGAAA